MKESVSPEEKLLRLIRGKRKTQPAELKPGAADLPAKTFRPVKSITLFLSGINPHFSSISGILLWVLILSCAAFLIIAVYSINVFRDITVSQETESTYRPLTLPKEERPLDYYLSATENRNIFSAPVTAQETTVKPEEPVNTDFIKDINLVGIFWGDNPQAAIEDKRTKKTYYVTAGENVADCKVEKIEEGKVVLNYRGQEFELYL